MRAEENVAVDAKRKRIDVYSFDYDRCFISYGDIVQANSAYLKEIVKTYCEFPLERPNSIKILIGSNRQHPHTDLEAIKQYLTDFQPPIPTYSCYTDIPKIAEHLAEALKALSIDPVTFDPFLLPDLFYGLSAGETHKEALTLYGDHLAKKIPELSAARNSGDGKKAVEIALDMQQKMKDAHKKIKQDMHDQLEKFKKIPYQDESKLILLYAQMHKIASENPDAIIHFHFLDDLEEKNSKSSILPNLRDFFRKHSGLISGNVVLHLHHYECNHYKKEIAVIEGQGDIDYNYRENTQKMVDAAFGKKKRDYSLDAIQFFNACDDDGLDNFKLNRVTQKKLDELPVVPAVVAPQSPGFFSPPAAAVVPNPVEEKAASAVTP